MPLEWREEVGDSCSTFVAKGELFHIKEELSVNKAPYKNEVKSHAPVSNGIVTIDDKNVIVLHKLDNRKGILRKIECLGIVCPHCLEVKRDLQKFNQHSILHRSKGVKCRICKAVFTDRKVLRVHIKNCYYSCPYCDKLFKNETKFQSHKESHLRYLD